MQIFIILMNQDFPQWAASSNDFAGFEFFSILWASPTLQLRVSFSLAPPHFTAVPRVDSLLEEFACVQRREWQSLKQIHRANRCFVVFFLVRKFFSSEPKCINRLLSFNVSFSRISRNERVKVGSKAFQWRKKSEPSSLSSSFFVSTESVKRLIAPFPVISSLLS